MSSSRRAYRHRGNVVDGLVGIELGALAADRGQRVDDFGAHAEQAQLEYLEEADGACADDDGIRDRGEPGAFKRQGFSPTTRKSARPGPAAPRPSLSARAIRD